MTTNKQGVQRYTDMGSETVCPINNMRKSDYGDYVLYEDYKALQTKCKELAEALEEARLTLEVMQGRGSSVGLTLAIIDKVQHEKD